MKIKETLYFSLATLLLFFSSCEPIEDRETLGPVLGESELRFEIIQEPAGSNTVRFVSQNKGILPYFDWETGYSNKADVEAYLPFAGNYMVTYTAYCAGGTVSTSREFSVSENDPEYFKNPAWNLLTNGEAGKTWVFATDIPETNYGGRIWGNGGFLTTPAGPAWWGRTAMDAKDDNIDLNSELYFDLEGAANFHSSENGIVTTGKFDMDFDNPSIAPDGTVWSIGTIELSGGTIPHGISQNEDKKTVYKFNICILTEDELVLSYTTGGKTDAGSEAWFWRFKRKGFSY